MVDTTETIKCPACQKIMEKVFMSKAGVSLDICTNGCGGIYFDNREMKHFDKPEKDIDEIIKVVEGKKFIEVDDKLPRICPVCGHNMVKNYSSSSQEVLIDECYICGGKFLDHGELTKIRAQHNAEK